MEDDLNFSKMEDDLIFSKIKDNLKVLENRRWSKSKESILSQPDPRLN